MKKGAIFRRNIRMVMVTKGRQSFSKEQYRKCARYWLQQYVEVFGRSNDKKKDDKKKLLRDMENGNPMTSLTLLASLVLAYDACENYKKRVDIDEQSINMLQQAIARLELRLGTPIN